MRATETRAVNRFLRKSNAMGLCSVEELGWHYGDGTNRFNLIRITALVSTCTDRRHYVVIGLPTLDVDICVAGTRLQDRVDLRVWPTGLDPTVHVVSHKMRCACIPGEAHAVYDETVDDNYRIALIVQLPSLKFARA